jgi:hypothetical protein
MVLPAGTYNHLLFPAAAVDVFYADFRLSGESYNCGLFLSYLAAVRLDCSALWINAAGVAKGDE